MNLRLAFLFLLLPFSGIAQDTLQLNVDTLLARIDSNRLGYTTLSERTVLTWDDGNTAQQVSGSIRLKKDSVVWLSLGMFGFEGARAFITADTFRLLNKLTAEYTVKDINYLRNWIALPVNFTMLQQMLTGERFAMDDRARMAVREDSAVVIYLESDKLQQKLWVDTVNYTLQKILLKDKLLKQDMTITFDSYNSLNQKPFSYKRSIVINRDGTVYRLDMAINRAQVNEELSYPFEVSDKYKRVE
jgi:hypothetical protein